MGIEFWSLRVSKIESKFAMEDVRVGVGGRGGFGGMEGVILGSALWIFGEVAMGGIGATMKEAVGDCTCGEVDKLVVDVFITCGVVKVGVAVEIAISSLGDGLDLIT